MDTTKKRRRTILFVVLAVLILLTAGGVWVLIQNNALNEARARSRSPQVFFNAPMQGEALPAGLMTPVTVTANGYQPLRSVELWVNGQIVEVQHSAAEEGSTMLFGHFGFLVQEGVNSLFARAVDVTGNVGASLPLTVSGERFADESVSLVAYGPDDTLEGLAETYGVDPDLIEECNPEAFGDEAPPEGRVEIPVIPPEPPAEGGVPPLPPATGSAAGKLCYPSEAIPAMTAYFENTSTKQVTQLPIQQNQLTYQVALSPGTYIAYAWLPDFSLGGAYTQAVPCGLTVSCIDHTPIVFTVDAGDTISGIDICDWYMPVVPAPPGGAGPAPAPPQAPSSPMLQAAKTYPNASSVDLPWAFTVPQGLTTVPTNLSAVVNGCSIRLSWSQLPSGVQGYAVWLSSQDGTHYLIAKLKPGDSAFTDQWYEFTSPVSGTVSLWVESFNALGTQASNPVTATVGGGCQPGDTGKLEFETLVVHTDPGVEQLYVYLSLEGVPEVRIPGDDSSFIAVRDGAAEVALFTQGSQKLVLPEPRDGELTIGGECWGWQGGDLQMLSRFSVSVPQSQWSGQGGALGEPRCQIDYRLAQAEPAGGTLQTFAGEGSGFPAPFNVRSIQLGDDSSLDAYEQYMWFWERLIKWQWKGDIKDITGFTIILNGQPLKTVAKSERAATVTLPGWCGPDMKWKVVANGVDGTKMSSEILTEGRPLCTKWAKVTFDEIHLNCTCDGYCKKYCPCDGLDIYFWIQVNMMTRKFFGGNFFLGLKCGYHQFAWMTGNKNEFIVTIYDGYPVDLKAYHKFYDYDTWSGNDLVSSFGETIWYPSFEYPASMVNDSVFGYWYDDVYDPPGEIFDDGIHHTGTSRSSYSIVYYLLYPKPANVKTP